MNTAIYLRVSTDEQAENGYGIDAQREMCEGMARAKDWQIVKEYSDDGFSGTLDESDRPGLAALLDAIVSGEVSAVIVQSLSRIGRSSRLIIRIVETIEGGADLVSCKESFDTSTATGRFVMKLFADMAEWERDSLTERLTAGRNARGRQDGERGGRQLPMGYKRTVDGPVIVPNEAVIIRGIFMHRAAGRSLTKIAEILNDQEIPARRGGKWYASSISIILKNEDAYRGGFRWESKVRWPVVLE